MTDEMVILKKQRAVQKGKITRLETFIKNFDIRTHSFKNVKVRLEELEKIWTTYQEIQCRIQVIDSNEEKDLEMEEGKYFAVKAAMENILDSTKTEIKPQKSVNIKLPTIDLPTFSENASFIIASVSGDAKELISNIPPTSENFRVAWNLLYKRYNSPKLIIQEHVRALLNLPGCNKESSTSLASIINKVRSHVIAIGSLQEITTPIHELMISQLILKNIDSISRRAWELHASNLPQYSLENLLLFLEEKKYALESMNLSQESSQATTSAVKKEAKGVKDSAKRSGLSAFVSTQLHSSQGCSLCKDKHHTLDNTPKAEGNSAPVEATNQVANVSSNPEDTTPPSNRSYCTLQSKSSQVVLATSLVSVYDLRGQTRCCRVLLDSAAQTNFVTESLVNQLGLAKHCKRIPIQGIGDFQSESKHCATLTLSSRCNSYNRTISCTVLRKITNELPSAPVNISNWSELKGVTLADPTFNKPGRIDLLLGAEIFFEILEPVPQIRTLGLPSLIATKLGWILSGPVLSDGQPNQHQPEQTFLSRSDPLHEQLQQFWNIEEISDKVLTKSEQLAEEHFRRNVQRDTTGRFQVRLPLKEDPSVLGSSYEGAFKRLLALERRFVQNPELKQNYTRFLDEYEAMGHMKSVAQITQSSKKKYYLPHHPVVKESSSTTKTRVVFDASSKTTTGLSLNDVLLVGPTIQQDLCSIVLRFRMHKICFTADIEKMYRQIRIQEVDTTLQRILWRRNDTVSIQEFELKTVTYGTASAPFLAVRCLHQLAEDEGAHYPEGARTLLEDMYVDDCISGTDDIESALSIQGQLTSLLARGGFHLRKWASNHSALLEAVPEADRETQVPLNLDKGETIKTLGLLWFPASDRFQIAHRVAHQHTIHTKRSILSIIAAIFDPLGLIGPVIILCKIFMQKLWQTQLSWNEQVPSGLQQQWEEIHSQLQFIGELSIERCVLVPGKCESVQLHGFADASEQAYGACIYVRSINSEGAIEVKLLCSKSRVSPIKRISVPRLELCGAVLLARLLHKVSKAITMTVDKVHLRTDSTIILSWLAASPSRWKTFVANRVTEIQQLTENAEWHHIPTAENPADLISRGAPPRLLKNNILWWNGPRLLSETSISISSDTTNEDNEALSEERITLTLITTQPVEWELITKFSNLTTLQRVTAYCIRFSSNCRYRKTTSRDTSTLTASELKTALLRIIRHVQQFWFRKEFEALAAGLTLPKGSRIANLNPFIDEEGCLRVGGRLKNATIDYEHKFQLILPHDHHVTLLIIRAEHLKLLHAGQNLLVSSLRNRFWIPRIRSVIRSVIGKCKICFRLEAKGSQQLMGSLPASRVQPARPFLNSGVDYAGPLTLKSGGVRAKRTIKAYVAVFVCMVTKAIHLELVSDLSTEAFIATLRRFISRRGRVQNLFSDNGTNFTGASSQLKALYAFLRKNKNKICDFAEGEDFQWHFIPPSAPHFGRLWEAGVKSMKFHLTRVVGSRQFTWEEMATLLCQIESILNSRPITPLSDTPNQHSFLTPGHFLTGEGLTPLPDNDYSTVSVNRINRWQQLQQCLQQVWKRWSMDYLHTLQQRGKWTKTTANIKPGSLVLLKENLPPLQWRTAIVEEVHPGADGLVRVVTVRTATGIIKRPITKLCPFLE